MAPYPFGHPKQGKPKLAPDAINNSWICSPAEGCSPNTLLKVVNAVRAAGIFPAVVAYNDGPGCSTIYAPPSIYKASVTEGATDSSNTIANFSSRGPVTSDGSNRRKPDLVAPGVNIRGAWPGNGYRSGYSGTSLAAPHVAGGVALIWQAKPALDGDVSGTEKLLEQTALHLTTTDGCGGDSDKKIPNNTYGYGLLNLQKAAMAQ